MANEEQRKAFAAYMRGASGSTARAGQPTPQYPGSVINPASQYLFNVNRHFPGFGIPPAAPTPPAAAASSVLSYQGLPGGFASQGAFGQASFPQRPPPLVQGQDDGRYSWADAQSRPTASTAPGFTQHSHSNTGQPPPPVINWRYTGPETSFPVQLSFNGVVPSVMTPSQRTLSAGMAQAKERKSDKYLTYQYQTASAAAHNVEEQTVPVLLCHTCSECGQMRSAGYHRKHPVIPGKPIVTAPCRKCKNRTTKYRRSDANSYTRIRTCTADEPYGWPKEPVHIQIDPSERRGRGRSRDEVCASWARDHLRPKVIKEGSSHAKIGLRTLQRSPQRVYRGTTATRVSSLNGRYSRYDGIWPPPDMFFLGSSKFDKPYAASEEVWPPPDDVRTHMYRKKSLPRASTRFVELSPSPPPAHSRATRIRYQEASPERRPKNTVHRSESRIRIEPHPRPHRTVIPDPCLFSQSDETSTNGAVSDAASHGILKSADMTLETSCRHRTSMRDSQQSTFVEVGGPRVQFAAELEREPRISDEVEESKDDPSLCYESHRYMDRPASPPIDRMERLHICRTSPSPHRKRDEIRIDRARRISPSPPRRYEKIRVRHVSVSPPSPLTRVLQRPPLPSSSERPTYSSYRHVSRTEAMERNRSLTPPPSRKQISSEDITTDTENDERDQVIEVRSWKGIDEKGQPATFFEERSRVRMIDRGSVSGSDYRPLVEKLATRRWREV